MARRRFADWRQQSTQQRLDGSTASLSQQIIGRESQDWTFTPHLNSPRRETVDDGRSYRNQRVCVSGCVFPDYAALHLQLAAMHPRLNDGLAYSYCTSSSSLCGRVTLYR
jgi:hypothetical protein